LISSFYDFSQIRFLFQKETLLLVFKGVLKLRRNKMKLLVGIAGSVWVGLQWLHHTSVLGAWLVTPIILYLLAKGFVDFLDDHSDY
jgi:hypothetical protein